MKDGKFHPMTEYKKSPRKKRLEGEEIPDAHTGVKINRSNHNEGIRLKRFDKTKIQTLIFPPSWSFSKVKAFLKKNDFKATKVVKEGDRIRARQFPPSDIKRGGDCRTISLGNSSVQAILCEVPVTRSKRNTEEIKIKGTKEQMIKKLMETKSWNGFENISDDGWFSGSMYLDNGEGRSGYAVYRGHITDGQVEVQMNKQDVPSYWRDLYYDDLFMDAVGTVEDTFKEMMEK